MWNGTEMQESFGMPEDDFVSLREGNTDGQERILANILDI